MRYAIILVTMLLTVQLAAADVVISQVLYDPLGTESGGEFVLLENSGESVDISGWVLATSSSDTDATIPDGVVLGDGSTYLIADAGWNTSKDDESWPEADHKEPITLKNSDSGVALKDVNGTVVDAVGWGTPDDTTLYEGTPAEDVAPGEALKRLNDTHDNLADFEAGSPTFNIASANGVTVTVTVLDAIVDVINITLLEDDDGAAGLQYTPYPAAVRALPLRVKLQSNRNVSVHAAIASEEQTAMTLTENEGLTQTFTGSALLPYHLAPGMHNITIMADDGEDIDVMKQEVEVLPLIALDVSVDELTFGSLLPGEHSRVTGDSDVETSSPTLSNIGNVNLHLAHSATPLISGAHSINVSAMRLTMDDFLTSTPLSESVDIIEELVATQGTSPIGFELNIPENAIGGTYQGTVTLVGVGVE